MVIDIINYTDEQLAVLKPEELLEVQEAQLKKDRLYQKLQEDFRNEKKRLVENGTFRSEIWNLYCERLQEEYEREVTLVRDALLFYLRFALKPEGVVTDKYTVDYALSMEERYLVVRYYYEHEYTDHAKGFEDFCNDEVAKGYLGEYYSTLYYYLLDLKNSM